MRDLYLSYEDVARLDVVPASLFRALIVNHPGLDPDRFTSPAALWAHRHQVPVELVDTLHRIGSLADQPGVDQIVHAAGGPLFAGPLDVPLVLAIRTLIEHPTVFDRALGRRFLEHLRPFREYTGLALVPSPAEGDLADLADGIEMALGRTCEIHTWHERDGIRYFCLEYAGCARIERDASGRQRIVSGPTIYDLVAYDPLRVRLRVFAENAHTADLLVSEFGLLLLGRGDGFRHCVRVTLDPLLTQPTLALEPTPSVLGAKVVELEVASRTAGNEVTIVRGEDVLHRLSDPSHQGLLRAARLRLRLRGERRPREVWLRVPDAMAWDWRRGNTAIREFLEDRRFLVGPAGGATWQAA